MSEHSNFKVLIVGGGIGGLTLANSLQHAGIDYLLLEARPEIAPQVGASIALQANGGRILDQLGAYDDCYRFTEPTVKSTAWLDGRILARRDGPALLTARTGYPVAFLDRQRVLEALHNQLWDKSKVRLGKRVDKIEHTAKGVTVHCKDGAMFDGDVVAGADGVHSIVRYEMWRNAEAEDPEKITQEEKNTMTAEYTCMYGISQGVEGLTPGDLHLVFGQDVSFLVIAGKNKRVFWFIFQKMDQTYHVPNIPRFSMEEATRQARSQLHKSITDKVSFGDIWDKQISYTLVALEEALFKTWSWGRFACLGDSVHKMTPNIGMGGNAAIESAAALSNSLKRMLSNHGSGSLLLEDIQASFEAYQHKREARIKAILTVANKQTRIDAFKGPIERFMVLKVIPYLGNDFIVNLQSQSLVGAERLEYLPVPERSLNKGMPFNQAQGVGNHDSVKSRAPVALPLLAFGYAIHRLMNNSATHQRNEKLDMTQMVAFLFNLAPIYLIAFIESHRRANELTFSRFPVLFATISLFLRGSGLTAMLPIYFFLHYIQSPVSRYKASDLRLVQVNYARTVLASILLGYILPATIGLYYYRYPSPASLEVHRQVHSLNASWLSQKSQFLLPVFAIYGIHTLLASFVKDTTPLARLKNPTADLPFLRRACLIIGAISAAASLPKFYVFAAIFSGTYSYNLHLPLSIFLPAIFWLALLFVDLKKAGMLMTTFSSLALLLFASIAVIGPGATVLAGWMWREKILATRRHKAALLKN